MNQPSWLLEIIQWLTVFEWTDETEVIVLDSATGIDDEPHFLTWEDDSYV